jgi:hypothetical protein
MPVCAQCGHEFDLGRFCTNCGHPVDAPVDEGLDLWRTDTTERPAHPARAPVRDEAAPAPAPAPTDPDATTRYPLFADQVTTPQRPEATHSHRAGRPWLPWVAGAVAMLLVAGLGAWLLFGGDDSDADLVAGEPRSDSGKEPSRQEKPGKQQKNKNAPPPRNAAGKPTDVSAQATAVVPATATPSTDFDGNVVLYEARNMLDGVPATTWRMPGDGAGETISLDLADETKLTRVGLINGYAKTGTTASGGALDWYAGNRRILSVAWVFDDGSQVTQELTETRKLQTVDIDPVTTSSVQLRLVTVSPPGQGPSRRDYTAISDVALVGSPS